MAHNTGEDEEWRESMLAGDDDSSHGAAPQAALVDPSGYYKTLGVGLTASSQEIRRAFLALSQRYHTDKHSDQAESVQEAMNNRFQELQDAYTVLSDDKQRAAYDAAGRKGAERLALVPSHYTSRKDIIGYIRSLDREAELIKKAKMLSATSEITIDYSTVPLFLTQGRREKVLRARDSRRGGGGVDGEPELPQSLVSEDDAEHTGATATAPAPATGSNSDAATASEGSSSGSSGAAGAGRAVQAQMVAKEVEVDGRRQVVFIPPEEMQQQIRNRIAAAERAAKGEADSSSGSADGDADGGEEGFLSAASSSSFWGSRTVNGQLVSLPVAAAVCVIPTSIHFRHSFQHMVSPRTVLLFRTDARSGRRRTTVNMSAMAEFQQDSIRTYAAVLRATVNGLKLTLIQQRVLNPVWTLRTKLVALDAGTLLQKFEMILTRKLTAHTQLTNGLAWSMTEYGHFFSSLSSSDAGGGSLTSGLFIGNHTMSLSLQSTMDVVYGTDVGDAKYPPARGSMRYSVNCSPFYGQTHAGFEAWYHHAPLQHYGIGFKTVLPYSFSPIAPPLFFVESSNFGVVNQISLLYERGSHTISIPVIVFISARVSQGLLWLGVPLLGYRIARLAYRPIAQRRAARHYRAIRRENLVEMDVARERAQLEQRALERLVLQSRAAEDRRGGLVIVNAQYGVLSPQFTETPSAGGGAAKASSGFLSRVLNFGRRALRRQPAPDAAESPEDDIPLSIDVTIALQNLVRDSALVLPGGTKSGLPGFCDPDPFTPERKMLKVTYWFHKKRHTVLVGDDDPLELPQRDHLQQ